LFQHLNDLGISVQTADAIILY